MEEKTDVKQKHVIAKEKCEEAVRLCQEAQEEGADLKQRIATAQRACEEAQQACEEAGQQSARVQEEIDEKNEKTAGCQAIIFFILVVLVLLGLGGCVLLLKAFSQPW